MKVSTWDKSLALTLAGQGMAVPEIAKRVNTSKVTVYAFLRSHGIKKKTGAISDLHIWNNLEDLDTFAKEQGYMGQYHLLKECKLPTSWSKYIYSKTTSPLPFIRQLWSKGLKVVPNKYKVNLIHCPTGKFQDLKPIMEKYGDEVTFWEDPLSWLQLHARDLKGSWKNRANGLQKDMGV